MKLIDVSTNKYPNTFVKVDDADFEWLNKWKWYLARVGSSEKSLYAVRNSRVSDGPPHRLIRMHTQILHTPKGMVCDHINGNHLDNRRENLRACLGRQNTMNMGKSDSKFKGGKRLTSKYKGVNFRKDCGLFRAEISVRKKGIHLGYFRDERSAAIAYNEAAKIHHGEFARLNEIDGAPDVAV